MAIIHLASNRSFADAEWPEGAYCPLGGSMNHFIRDEDDSHKNMPELEYRTMRAMMLYSTHHGLCVSDREKNGYDDSDFYMTVWNTVGNCPEEIFYATTRGWSYPCFGSDVDATPEVREAYDKYCVEARRQAAIRARWNNRKAIRQCSKAAGITTSQYKRLLTAYPLNTVEACTKLLASKLRSDFRKSLAKQLREWLNDPEPKYNYPFSPKQVQFI